MLNPSSSPTDAPRAIRIIYAEDVRELRDLARVVFTREGHVIECVSDGLEALDKITATPEAFDLVITDHHMPRMNGLDLVANLRRGPYKGKIMVFSSELNPAISTEYQRLAVDRILFKPVYPSYLRQAIMDLFPAHAERDAGVEAAP